MQNKYFAQKEHILRNNLKFSQQPSSQDADFEIPAETVSYFNPNFKALLKESC